jgi:hypothetical protein
MYVHTHTHTHTHTHGGWKRAEIGIQDLTGWEASTTESEATNPSATPTTRGKSERARERERERESLLETILDTGGERALLVIVCVCQSVCVSLCASACVRQSVCVSLCVLVRVLGLRLVPRVRELAGGYQVRGRVPSARKGTKCAGGFQVRGRVPSVRLPPSVRQCAGTRVGREGGSRRGAETLSRHVSARRYVLLHCLLYIRSLLH